VHQVTTARDHALNHRNFAYRDTVDLGRIATPGWYGPCREATFGHGTRIETVQEQEPSIFTHQRILLCHTVCTDALMGFRRSH
jgi:hypothetical protein